MKSGCLPWHLSLIPLSNVCFLGPTWKTRLSYALASLALIVITHCSALIQFLMSDSYFINFFVFFMVGGVHGRRQGHQGC